VWELSGLSRPFKCFPTIPFLPSTSPLTTTTTPTGPILSAPQTLFHNTNLCNELGKLCGPWVTERHWLAVEGFLDVLHLPPCTESIHPSALDMDSRPPTNLLPRIIHWCWRYAGLPLVWLDPNLKRFSRSPSFLSCRTRHGARQPTSAQHGGGGE